MKLLKFRSASFFIGASLLALSTLSVGILVTAKNVSQQAEAYYTPSSTYTNGDAATYYNGISGSATGTTLLTALQSLNNTKIKNFNKDLALIPLDEKIRNYMT